MIRIATGASTGGKHCFKVLGLTNGIAVAKKRLVMRDIFKNQGLWFSH